MTGSRVSEPARYRRGIVLLLICLFLGIASCASGAGDKVVVVEKTRTYHRAECPRVMMAHGVWMTREEAQALDCKPCPGCRPDSRR
jgi:hypothetical protein